MIYCKPTLWCLLLHQSVWGDMDEEVEYCPTCDRMFLYPSRKVDEPRY